MMTLPCHRFSQTAGYQYDYIITNGWICILEAERVGYKFDAYMMNLCGCQWVHFNTEMTHANNAKNFARDYILKHWLAGENGERIREAAIMYYDKSGTTPLPALMLGKSHADCIMEFRKLGLYTRDRDMKFEQQGFITTSGRFVDRHDGYIIARSNRQIEHETADEILYSEMIKV